LTTQAAAMCAVDVSAAAEGDEIALPSGDA